MPFASKVKKNLKDAANKSGDIDGTSKRKVSIV